ncbi:MAG: hypothetical protein M3Q26_05195, partial [Acidobacteriota bacterium]|nr:hypothetical protein [Acidobacteriota bacterium]
MNKALFIVIVFLFFTSFGSAAAQDATLIPTPSPTVEKRVDDKQEVTPENIKGVPAIAPGYSSEDRDLPDLGRVGVDMADQRPLTVSEAIALALENNKDIEVTRKNV